MKSIQVTVCPYCEKQEYSSVGKCYYCNTKLEKVDVQVSELAAKDIEAAEIYKEAHRPGPIGKAAGWTY